MRRSLTILASVLFLTSVTAGASFATPLPFWIEVDVSSLAGPDIELEIDLFDNSGVIGDSWAFIDNVSIQDASSAIIEEVDFETGTLEGFDDSMNPDSVNIVPGASWSGNYMMRIDEDPMWTPTITWRDFPVSDAATLHMEFQFISSGASGEHGRQDALVAWLLDPIMPDPPILGLTGCGDFLEATESGNLVSDEVTGIEPIPEPIPEPSTILLMLSGLGGIAAFGKLRLRKR